MSSPPYYTKDGVTYKKYHENAMEHLMETLKLAKHGSKIYIPLYIMGGSGKCYTEDEIGIMREIVSHGGTVFLGKINKYSDTALHLAYCHDNQPMIDFLLENGADPDAKRYNGLKPHELRPTGPPPDLNKGVPAPSGSGPVMILKSGVEYKIHPLE